jgi:hypothetical protein
LINAVMSPLVSVLTCWLVAPCVAQPIDAVAAFRPPAVPLVTHDPYLSVWSFNDRLTDAWSRHWTGKTQALCGLVMIDDKPYRWCGAAPDMVAAMEQIALVVRPTTTLCTFRAGGVELVVEFVSPLLPHDLDLVSRPITYLTLYARALDGAAHRVRVYADCPAEWAVNTPDQSVRWSRARSGALHVLSVGTQEQPVLKRVGDDVRIDWGVFYLALPDAGQTDAVIAAHTASRMQFASAGILLADDDLRQPRPANDDWPVLAGWVDLGAVEGTARSAEFYLGYDDQYSIEYFKRPLRAYWRRAGAEFADALSAAKRERGALIERCRTFDAELVRDLTSVGGEPYAQLAALAYRQTLAAHKLVADIDGTPLMFPKENFSNGCIATVDVIYPSSPFFLLLNPVLLEAQLRPVLDYARSPRWRFPFAPHDLGAYPHANGQVYGGGERTEDNQMPVEECGNMLLMMAALVQAAPPASADATDGQPSGSSRPTAVAGSPRGPGLEFAARYMTPLKRWAEYLVEHGLDPANQLCTDDFAGHLAHNANLSLKAILAIGAYARIAERLGAEHEAGVYRRKAEAFAARWRELAADGDHYRLAFDKPGTWSQKYNLVWDRVLGLNLFPAEIARTEVAYYAGRLNRFGLPLDNREAYTKLDWAVWTACLTESRGDFERFIGPLFEFAHQSPSRVPLTDWFSTTDGRQIGFQARSVVGGVYMPMLRDAAMWRKWCERVQPASRR